MTEIEKKEIIVSFLNQLRSMVNVQLIGILYECEDIAKTRLESIISQINHNLLIRGKPTFNVMIINRDDGKFNLRVDSVNYNGQAIPLKEWLSYKSYDELHSLRLI